MAQIERIEVEDARRRVRSGKALLVCAYPDEQKCEKVRLEDAISLGELEARSESVPKDRELIFYCA
jgi:hypothetical protein